MGLRTKHLRPMTVTEALEAVGISRNVFLGWLASGHVDGAYRTLGNRGHWRLRRPDFDDWLTRYQLGQIDIPRKRKTARRPPVKGGLRQRLMEVRFHA